jgi:hypothetical protein
LATVSHNCHAEQREASFESPVEISASFTLYAQKLDGNFTVISRLDLINCLTNFINAQWETVATVTTEKPWGQKPEVRRKPVFLL